MCKYHIAHCDGVLVYIVISHDLPQHIDTYYIPVCSDLSHLPISGEDVLCDERITHTAGVNKKDDLCVSFKLD